MYMSDKKLFKAGQALGPYRVVRCIGRGGMGEVYEVEHEGLGVRYALKAFAYRGGESWPMLRAKFMEEGQVLARLRHPNLVRVFDLAVDGGTAYYVMDLVLYKDGNPYTLDDVDRTSVEEDHLFIWFRDLCNALDYVHSQGVVHRDVKLGNILLNADKHVTLSDFGIAHIFGDGMVKAPAGACVTDAFCASGRRAVLGTDCYIAPEVTEGGEATPASDTYALGVAMFRLLTGVWYEPGLDVRALLAGREWKYRWLDVLPGMLATEPFDRPQILAQSVMGLQPYAECAKKGCNGVPRRWMWIAASACVVMVAGVGLLAGLMAWRSGEARKESAVREEKMREAAEKEAVAHQREEKDRLQKEEAARARLKAEEAAAEEKRKTEEESRRRAEEAARLRAEEDARRKAEESARRGVEEEAKCQAESMHAEKVKQISTRQYAWRDGSGKPQEVVFEFGEGNTSRLIPLEANGTVFWISRLPITAAAWRRVIGGLEKLKSIEESLPSDNPLCVVSDRKNAETFCREMTKRVKASLPEGYEVRLPTDDECCAALAENETAKRCEATGRSVDDCVGAVGAVARARFSRLKSDCQLDRFGKWSDHGRLADNQVAVGGLPMPRASGVVGLTSSDSNGVVGSLHHFVVGKKRID